MIYQDYYAVLGVPRDADLDQIKKAYRTLARTYHPDVSKAPDAEARFKDAALAYATLKDSEKRAAYDQLGNLGAGTQFTPPPQWGQDYATGTQGFEDIDMAELLAAMGRGGRRANHSSMPIRGTDYEKTVSIKLEDARTGVALNLDLVDEKGSRSLEVSIPSGVSDGQKLRLRGKGGRGRNGGADGDIYLHVKLLPHALFRADHHDLYFDLVLAPWEAILGADIEIETLDGPVLLTVPAGSRSGRKLRIRSRGLVAGKSDLFALVTIAVPTTLSARERELYLELSRISDFNPRKVAQGITT